uniref:Link domain-containing protein n=1 Tax=Anas platyrhynchos platyrhynchos TaxID=8840 RepID=A0A493TNT8_ANAPP
MAQWQEVQNLANTHLEQVHQLYAAAALPMAVRQCLAAWIEDQDWRRSRSRPTPGCCSTPCWRCWTSAWAAWGWATRTSC